MKLPDFIIQLQNKPYQTRVRILWFTTAVVALIIAALWLVSLKVSVKDINVKDLDLSLPNLQNATKYIVVERAIIEQANTKIFFKVQNSTDDILNFSTSESISLKMDNQALTPTSILDRQNKPFVQKILSNQQEFGILSFKNNELKEGQLIFDHLYFEKQPEKIFKEIISIDLNKLIKQEQVRN